MVEKAWRSGTRPVGFFFCPLSSLTLLDRGQGGPVYGSADKWDGLGLFLTAEPDGSGLLHAHLNDRTTSYNKLESSGGSSFSLDRLFAKTDAEKNAFASCSFAYRNLGSISNIRVSYNAESLKVMHDNELCFESTHVALPTDYYFGVSAQSGETPDSHELFNFDVKAESHVAAKPEKTDQTVNPGRPSLKKPAGDVPSALDSAMQKVITKLIADSDKMSSRIEELSQMKSTIERIEAALQKFDGSVGTKQSVSSGSDTKAMYEDFASQIRSMENKFVQMEKHIEKQTDHIVASLPPVAGPLKNAVYVLIMVQIVICGAYIMYRRKTEEKSKFL